MIYTLTLYLYSLIVRLAAIFNPKARLMIRGQRNTYKILRSRIQPNERYVWFHAASLGEFEQGRPLIETFRKEHPELRILLTFFSPSGYEVRKNYEGADVVCYLPFDTPSGVRKFMHLAHPYMAFFIKYEFWSHYLHACHREGIPVYSVSSIFRPNQVFFRWYGGFARSILHQITHFFVQDENSYYLLKKIGLENVTVVGDTRFDRVLSIYSQRKDLALLKRFKGQNHVLIVGSSWESDENLIIPYFNIQPNLKLVLAPHVVSENHLNDIQSKLKRPFIRYSQASEYNIMTADCLIIDCYGLLSSIYKYGEVAYVGGGFGAGIHNVPEAAVYGLPVLIGPNNKKFREAQDLLKLGGCKEVVDSKSFARIMDYFINNEHKRKKSGLICATYIKDHSGATNLILNKIRFS